MVRIKHRYLLFNILYPSVPVSITAPIAPLPVEPSCVLFSRASPPHLSPSSLLHLLRAELSALFGDHGLSVTQAGLRLVYFSPATSTGILRVPRAHFRLVWAAMTCITEIPAPSHAEKGKGGGAGGPTKQGGTKGKGTGCVLRVVRVSGTIKKSEQELLRVARRDVVRAKLEGRDTATMDLEGDGLGMFAGADPKGKPTVAARKQGDRIEDFEDEEDLDISDED